MQRSKSLWSPTASITNNRMCTTTINTETINDWRNFNITWLSTAKHNRRNDPMSKFSASKLSKRWHMSVSSSFQQINHKAFHYPYHLEEKKLCLIRIMANNNNMTNMLHSVSSYRGRRDSCAQITDGTIGTMTVETTSTFFDSSTQTGKISHRSFIHSQSSIIQND